MQKKKILVVDDDENVRELLTDFLEALSYNVSAAGNGKKALNFLQNNGAVDLITTDNRMPEMNGPELICQLKARYSQIPIIFITGDTDQKTEASAYAAGAKKVLHKPISVDSLKTAIEDLIGPADPFSSLK